MFAERLRQLRRKHNFSQEELAGRVGVHANTVSSWENGVIPKTKKLQALAEILGTTSAYLLGETNNVVLQEGITQGNPAPDNESMNEKRIIIKNNDMYVNLPETPEGFEVLRRFFRMQEEKSGADVIHTLAQA